MTKNYWLDRWVRDEIGFHQDGFNPYLVEYWKSLELAAGSQVFIPLCGKTRDMLWLRNQGHAVLGVELSTLAVQAFFKENGLQPDSGHFSDKRFEHYAADCIQILNGDFFDLRKNDLAGTCAVYDRASLVALPPDMRRRYAGHMCNILPPGTKILLVSFDYPQAEMQGPPYAVSPDEVIALYRDYAEINVLAKIDILEDNPRFQQRGLSRLQESVFLLTMESMR